MYMFQKTFHGKFIISSNLYFEYNRFHNMSGGNDFKFIFLCQNFWDKITLFIM
jgi:hypothetical protein